MLRAWEAMIVSTVCSKGHDLVVASGATQSGKMTEWVKYTKDVIKRCIWRKTGR